MHVGPPDFRAVRRDGVLLHFALLDTVVFALAEFPGTGSRGTFAEEPCERPHWGFTVAGAIELHLDGSRHEIEPGAAFHVPAGVVHRVVVPGQARVAAFDRLPPDAPTTDDALRAAGYEVVRGAEVRRRRPVSIVPPRPHIPPGEGEIAATSWRMGDLLFTRVRLGRRAGYVTLPCDASHWGLVVAGSLAIEWEDSIEVVGRGDVFYCPPGPPGHRIEAAEPAVAVDFTPIDDLRTAARVAPWRAEAAHAALAEPAAPARLEVTALG